MTENEKEKNEYVTPKYLDERLSEQTQIIISAVESVLDKRLNEVRDDLRVDINNVQTLIDGYVKAQEDFKQEFVIVKEEMKKIKQVLKDKLGVEIKAI